MNQREHRIDARRRILRRVGKSPDARGEMAVVQRLSAQLARDASLEAVLATAMPRADIVRRRIASEHLFAGQVEIEIRHGDWAYRLRQTSLGKHASRPAGLKPRRRCVSGGRSRLTRRCRAADNPRFGHDKLRNMDSHPSCVPSSPASQA